MYFCIMSWENNCYKCCFLFIKTQKRYLRYFLFKEYWGYCWTPLLGTRTYKRSVRTRRDPWGSYLGNTERSSVCRISNEIHFRDAICVRWIESTSRGISNRTCVREQRCRARQVNMVGRARGGELHRIALWAHAVSTIRTTNTNVWDK